MKRRNRDGHAARQHRQAAPGRLQGPHRPVDGGGNQRRCGGPDPLLVELVRIRTFQINGCAFCLRLHTRDALKKGENPDRIAVLPG
jgi:AhpD family alkylhydroperoxidase